MAGSPGARIDDQRPLWLGAWRLALLASGDADRATRIVGRIARAHRDVHAASDARLIHAVLAAAAPCVDRPDGLEGDALLVWQRLGALDDRSRSAWLLVETHGLPMARVAPVLAPDEADRIEPALAEARAALATAADRPADLLLAWTRTRQTPLVAAALERSWRDGAASRRRLSIVHAAILLACFATMIYVLVDLLGWDERKAKLEAETDWISNPMPTPDGGTP